jgi:uncharacterized membrane protein YoaK (UPF0700 family)
VIVLEIYALNTSFGHIGHASVSLTNGTGTLVKPGQGLGKALYGKGLSTRPAGQFRSIPHDGSSCPK